MASAAGTGGAGTGAAVPVRLGDEKLNVCAPSPSIRRLVNVATPLTAVRLVVPTRAPVPAETVAVTTRVAPVTTLPPASRTCTTGWVVNTTPLTAPAGWTASTS